MSLHLRHGFARTLQDKDGGSHIPEMDVRIARALLDGAHPKDVVCEGSVSLRTAYRWRRELVAIESVRVDGWVATFARRRDQPPVRLTAWEVA